METRVHMYTYIHTQAGIIRATNTETENIHIQIYMTPLKAITSKIFKNYKMAEASYPVQLM